MDWRHAWLVFTCNVMGWHRMGPVTEVSGPNVHGTCKRCGVPCMLDSQGNAFPIITLNEHNTEEI